MITTQTVATGAALRAASKMATPARRQDRHARHCAETAYVWEVKPVTTGTPTQATGAAIANRKTVGHVETQPASRSAETASKKAPSNVTTATPTRMTAVPPHARWSRDGRAPVRRANAPNLLQATPHRLSARQLLRRVHRTLLSQHNNSAAMLRSKPGKPATTEISAMQMDAVPPVCWKQDGSVQVSHHNASKSLPHPPNRQSRSRRSRHRHNKAALHPCHPLPCSSSPPQPYRACLRSPHNPRLPT